METIINSNELENLSADHSCHSSMLEVYKLIACSASLPDREALNLLTDLFCVHQAYTEKLDAQINELVKKSYQQAEQGGQNEK